MIWLLLLLLLPSALACTVDDVLTQSPDCSRDIYVLDASTGLPLRDIYVLSRDALFLSLTVKNLSDLPGVVCFMTGKGLVFETDTDETCLILPPHSEEHVTGRLRFDSPDVAHAQFCTVTSWKQDCIWVHRNAHGLLDTINVFIASNPVTAFMLVMLSILVAVVLLTHVKS